MELYSHYSGKLGLICFAIWLVMLIRGRKVVSGTTVQSNNYWFVFICMILYSVLGFLEWDTYHYYSIYKQIKQSGQGVHIENIYVWLINNLPNSYLLFRLIVWGLASLLMVLSFKKLNLNANVLAMTVPMLILAELTNTRGSLGLTLLVFCSIVFVQSLEQKRIIPFIIAILGIIASSFFHRSMLFFIVILIFAYIIPFNKRIFVISLLLFPFLYGIAYQYVYDSTLMSYLSEDQMSVINDYQSQEYHSSNLNGLINTVFSKLILLLLVFNISQKYLYKKINVNKSEFLMFKFAYFMVYISFLFLRTDVSNWLSTRSLHAGTFALLMCATKCLDHEEVGGKRTIIEQFIVVGYIFAAFWRQFYFMRNFWY